MTTYYANGGDSVKCTIDGVTHIFRPIPDGAPFTIDDIPDGPHKDFLRWLESGGVPEPADIQLSPDAYRKFYGSAKLDIFDDSEQLKFATTAMSDAEVKLFYDRIITSEYISLANPKIEAGLSMLVDKGILTKKRKTEIIKSMK